LLLCNPKLPNSVKWPVIINPSSHLMLEFIHLLKQRYQSQAQLLTHESHKAVYQLRIDQLILAEAFIRKGQSVESMLKPIVQIAVVGPTQAGKSSLVNMMLNDTLAGVSPLAGYTAHPQGFCKGVTVAECSGLQRYFGRFQQMPLSQLTKNRYDCYALTESKHDSGYLPRCVLWDTPDFDSIDSAHYREGVLRTIALADIIILALSKEKYADQSVWDLMSDLEALHQPTIICLNKLSDDSEAILIRSLKEKWSLVRKDAFPNVVPLYYQKAMGAPIWPDNQKMLIKNLAKQVEPSVKNYKSKHARYAQELLQRHWSAWLEPVHIEHQALKEWRELVDLMLKRAMENYRRDFLNHPHHYETFQKALVELLTLLEIPGIAVMLAGTRKILTWPIKQIQRLGRRKVQTANNSNETALLNQIAEHILIQLADQLIDKAEQSQFDQWWRECNQLLRAQRISLLQSFEQAVSRYHAAFEQDVEKTARRLYQKLQDQPMVLNSLRATRATTDAAAIALAIHTGGIGVQDLVFAPAMLTVTSLLAESAIGGYMHSVEADLKQQQFDTVKQQLFTENLCALLLRLPEQLSTARHFNISPGQLQAAENQLSEKRHGLRLL